MAMGCLKATTRPAIRWAAGAAIALGLAAPGIAPWSIGASNAADPFELKSDVPIIRRGLNEGLDSLPDNASTAWANPATGNSGTLLPKDRISDQIGRSCRNYLRTWTVNNGTTTIRGLACREEAGYWRVQSETDLGRVENTPRMAQVRPSGGSGPAAGNPIEPVRNRPPRQQAVRSSSPTPAAPPSVAIAPVPALPPNDPPANEAVVAASATSDRNGLPAEPPLASVASAAPAVEPRQVETPLAQLPTRSVLR
jgi:hypothetical protein